VDTNVLIDLMLCNDVVDALIEAQNKSSEVNAKAFYRFDRAAFALRMAIYFHETRAITVSDGGEVLRKSTQLVAPDAIDIAGWYRHLWLSFSKPLLLRGWRIASDSTDAKGSVIDDALIAHAKAYNRPLISNEGMGHNGPTGRTGIRTKAREAGVTVMTAEQFCRGKLSRTRWKRFLREFKRLGPSVYNGHAAHALAQRQLAALYKYYAALLLGTEPDAIVDRVVRRSPKTPTGQG
jgi:hypothetical protein